jgi:hypothetical protein
MPEVVAELRKIVTSKRSMAAEKIAAARTLLETAGVTPRGVTSPGSSRSLAVLPSRPRRWPSTERTWRVGD